MVRFQTRPTRQDGPPSAFCTPAPDRSCQEIPGPGDSCLDILRKSLQQPRDSPDLGGPPSERKDSVRPRTVGSSAEGSLAGRASSNCQLAPVLEDSPAHEGALHSPGLPAGTGAQVLKIPGSLPA